MNNVENKLVDIKHQIERIFDYQVDLEYAEEKLIGLDNRLRRNNLRIDGILETPGETWENCEEKLQQVFHEKLGLKWTIEIEQEQRMSIRQISTNNRSKLQTIICNLLRHKNKVRRTQLFISGDFSRETMELRRKVAQKKLKHVLIMVKYLISASLS